MLILLNDTYIESSHVTAVRESELDSDQTCVWVVGADTLTGAFLIDMPVEEVVEALNAVAMRTLAESLMEDIEDGYSTKSPSITDR